MSEPLRFPFSGGSLHANINRYIWDSVKEPARKAAFKMFTMLMKTVPGGVLDEFRSNFEKWHAYFWYKDDGSCFNFDDYESGKK
jgi:hypothetical protein